MSIASQAAFFYRSVCDYDKSMDGGTDLSESVRAGFAEFSALLRTIYQDWRSYEVSTLPREITKIGITADDLENFHNMIYTVLYLKAIAAVGELRSEGETRYFSVAKSALKDAYRKTTPVKFILSMLEKYGFQFVFYKGIKETVDYARSDHFDVYCKNESSLLEAMKYIANRLSEPERHRSFSKEAADIESKMPGDVTFLTADYHLILTGRININPLDESILRTLGTWSDLWRKLAALLRDEYGFGPETVKISCSPYVFPEKTVYFTRKSKTVCKFEIRADRLSIWLPDSFEAAKKLILNTENLPPVSFTPVAGYVCSAYCGKCDHGSVCSAPKTIAALDLK